MIRYASFFLIVSTAALLAAAYSLGGQMLPAAAALAIGACWIISLVRRWKWASALSLFAAYALAAAGFLIDLSPLLLTIGGFCAFLAWDLAEFTLRLSLAAPEDDPAPLVRRHLIWLSIVTIAGAAAVTAMHLLRVKPTFEWMAVLLIFAAWGLGRVMNRALRRD